MPEESKATLKHGAVVRLEGEPPNYLVLRCLGDVTTVVSAEIDEIGTPRIRSFPTGKLLQVLSHD